MRFWLSLLCLSLLAGPLAAEPIRSGEMRLSPAASIRLAPRAEDFVPRLCPGKGRLERMPGKNSALCCGKRSNVPGSGCVLQGEFLSLGIVSMQALEEGTLRASLFARAFAFQGRQPLETPCGRWTYALWLDPRATQPVSTMILRPGARAAAAGTFSGALPISAKLSFEKPDEGRRVIVPVSLRLDLAGSWTVAATDRGIPGGPAASHLQFSIDVAQGAMALEGAPQ